MYSSLYSVHQLKWRLSRHFVDRASILKQVLIDYLVPIISRRGCCADHRFEGPVKPFDHTVRLVVVNSAEVVRYLYTSHVICKLSGIELGAMVGDYLLR